MTTIHGFMKTTKSGERKQASIKTIPLEYDGHGEDESSPLKESHKKDAVKIFKFLITSIPSGTYQGLKRLITLYETDLATKVYTGKIHYSDKQAIKTFLAEKSE